MLIKSLKLKGFRKVAYGTLSRFEITLNEKVQIFLGSNGSGKSITTYQLTPLPPDSNDFTKDGHKIIEITHNGNEYILTSTFSPNRHSFIKNGDELNAGGTISVFKELVKQEFNLTTEIHDLLTGMELFHEMSPARRREWFTKLSDTNYDYALGVYNKLREKSRDISGALKLAKRHLVNESSKLVTEEEADRLREEINLTHTELNLLLSQTAPIDKPASHYESEKIKRLEELQILSDRLLRLKLVAPYGTYPYGINPHAIGERDDCGQLIIKGFESIEEIDAVTDEIKNLISKTKTVLEIFVKDHDEVSKNIEMMKKTGNEGIHSLQKRLHEDTVTRIKLIQSKELGFEVTDANAAIQALDTVFDLLTSIASTIPVNTNRMFSQARLTELNEELNREKDNKEKQLSDLNKLKLKITHLESHKNNQDTVCPKCNHSWIPGYSEKDLSTIISLADVEETKLKERNDKIEVIEKNIQDINDYILIYRDYIGIVKHWTVLRPLWDYFTANDMIFNNPRSISSIVNKFKADLEIDVKISIIDKNIEETKQLIKMAEELGDANLTALNDRYSDLTANIEHNTGELTRLQSALNKFVLYKKQLIESNELSDKIKELSKHVTELNESHIEMMRRETLNHCIRQLQSSLAMKESTIQAINIQIGIVNDLKQQIEKLEVEEEAAKILVKELSPTDGLIAEGLLGFIKVFIKQMNKLIKKIWTYPLTIQDCGINESELDYKFALIVQDKDNIVSDVKFGSTGMREIVNLAFKLIAMKHLHLDHGSLYLDEPGSSFDVKHRTSISNLIKTIMETENFRQLFLISHDVTIYGSFTNIEVTVLDSNNVIVPKVFNKHVIME